MGEHVKFAIEFDAVVVLPAMANILCKVDLELLMTLYQPYYQYEQPKLFAPLMNFRMWQVKLLNRLSKNSKIKIV